MTKNSVVFALTLIRHGETQCNKEEIIQGQQDVPLSEEGVKQAVLLGSRLQNQKYTHVYASDLARALQTTKHVLEKNNMCKSLPIQKDPRLRERKYGTVEGKTRQDLRRAARKQKLSLANFTPPGGETIHQVRQRAEVFFKELCQQLVGRKLDNLNTPSNGNNSWKYQLPRLSGVYGHRDPQPPDKALNLSIRQGTHSSQSTEVVYVVPNAAAAAGGQSESKRTKSQGTHAVADSVVGESNPTEINCADTQQTAPSGKNLASDLKGEVSCDLSVTGECLTNAALNESGENARESETSSNQHSSTTAANQHLSKSPNQHSEEICPTEEAVCQDCTVSCTDSAVIASADKVNDAAKTEMTGENNDVTESTPGREAKRAKIASSDDESAEKTPLKWEKTPSRTRFHIEDSDDEIAESEVYKDVTPNVVVSRTSKEPVVMQRCDSDPLMDVGEDVILSADILVVSHGGFLRELIRHFIDDFNCIVPGGDVSALTVSPNTGVSKFMISFSEDTDKPQLTCIFIHDREHLNIAHYKNTKYISDNLS
ncbi:uncharacterized protein [Ptychodera flava]|uniref:uncharacterized protein n=1 Tax=Ptychodera flava TaxID=63121 RepID=UPI00396A9A4E